MFSFLIPKYLIQLASQSLRLKLILDASHTPSDPRLSTALPSNRTPASNLGAGYEMTPPKIFLLI